MSDLNITNFNFKLDKIILLQLTTSTLIICKQDQWRIREMNAFYFDVFKKFMEK